MERNHISKLTSGRIIDLEEIRDEQRTQNSLEAVQVDEPPRSLEEPVGVVPQNVVAPRKSKRTIFQPDRWTDVLLTENLDVLILDSDEPLTYKQAMTSPSSTKWLEAMQSEIDSMSEKIKFGIWLICRMGSHLSDANGSSN